MRGALSAGNVLFLNTMVVIWVYVYFLKIHQAENPFGLCVFRYVCYTSRIKFIFKKRKECTLSDIWFDIQRQIALGEWVDGQLMDGWMDRLLNGQLERLTSCNTIWAKTAAVAWNPHPQDMRLCSSYVLTGPGPGRAMGHGWASAGPYQWRHQRVSKPWHPGPGQHW